MYGDLSRTRLNYLRDAPNLVRIVLARRPVLYVLVVIGAALIAYLFALRNHGIFACTADGYRHDQYLAECTAPSFGDYEHGAFWFGLEPTALTAASKARVLFLGDSRSQIAFSAPAVAEWFEQSAISYYLLGFGSGENVAFIGMLLARLRPRAQVYVINADTFFDRTESPPAKIIMQDVTARTRFEGKRFWQTPHKLICSNIPHLCGSNYAVFRSRNTGAYEIRGAYNMRGQRRRSEAVSYQRTANLDRAQALIVSGQKFLASAGISPHCIILTSVPYVETDIETARAVAAGLKLAFVAPELNKLRTFDTSHLDADSAQLWSKAFLAEAAGHIRRCLDG